MPNDTYARPEPSPESCPKLESTAAAVDAALNIGLIDTLCFSRDCLTKALEAAQTDLVVVAFATPDDCVQSGPSGLDLILYYSHEAGQFHTLIQHIKDLRQACGSVPIIVFSDSASALLPESIASVLSAGAQGFIPTRVTELPAALAGIRFVQNGGVFAPLELLLAGEPEGGSVAAQARTANALTPRQKSVLSHLRVGKANKIIAYELGMTESTVKIHVRNIMRKMGATNRTQAVYKAQEMFA